MYEWYALVQQVVEDIDISLKNKESEELTLSNLAKRLGYSKFHTTRQFQALSGMSLKAYIAKRKLAFALIEVRDSDKTLLEIALDCGFSSHEAFSRAFKENFSITPSAYRKNPKPVVLRTKINTFDRYILGIGEIGMIQSEKNIKVYYVTIPAHKFLHIKNQNSHGYFDFWQKQEAIPEQDCDTICGLLDSIKGKLDGDDSIIGQFSGQVMGVLHEADGRTPEAYGIRLPADYADPLPEQMLVLDVPESEYIVFEHGPFIFTQEGDSVNQTVEAAIAAHNYEDTEYQPDATAGRVAYFYHDPTQFLKWVLPVRKK